MPFLDDFASPSSVRGPVDATVESAEVYLVTFVAWLAQGSILFANAEAATHPRESACAQIVKELKAPEILNTL